MFSTTSSTQNRIELEAQVLSAALRQSLTAKDHNGIRRPMAELCELYPDLLPRQLSEDGESFLDFYKVLSIRPHSSHSWVLAYYLRKLRKLLRESQPSKDPESYRNVLDAGFVLRKPRLRLSHDMVLTYSWLSSFPPAALPVEEAVNEQLTVQSQEEKAQEPELEQVQGEEKVQEPEPEQVQGEEKAQEPEPEQVQGEEKVQEPEPEQVQGEEKAQEPEPEQVQEEEKAQEPELEQVQEEEKAQEPELEQVQEEERANLQEVPGDKADQSGERMVDYVQPSQLPPPLPSMAANSASSEKPAEKSAEAIPLLIKLLRESRVIDDVEVQAVMAQRSRAPEIPLEALVLNSGYISQQEMYSLKLAESLIVQGKITMGQFQVAFYDERTTGVRMAESLQTRGWLETDVSKNV
jgi:hypothetical protein